MEMEEESQCLKINGEEDFYEKIEAPKFVDLNAPDQYHPGDDRYWFCLRVGCDQKHEEEMDSEAIYKNFVLRVMAARSPNIRLRKALYRKDSGANIKCPQTAPAKSSKPRVSRLALISSISKKMVDQKVKVKPLAKRNATPNVREKQSSVASKALTTPRNKKRLSNPDAFRSVRNPKAMDIANSRVVAKALFRSPNKSVSTKTLTELDTTVKKNMCRRNQEMVLGESALLLNVMKEIIHMKGFLTTVKIEPSLVENKAEALSDANENTQSNYEERGSGENDVPKLLASSEEGTETSERHGEEDEMNSSLDKGTDGIMESNDRKHILISDDKENDVVRYFWSSVIHEFWSCRDMDLNTGHLKRQTLGKHESVKSTQMIAKAMRKPSKKNFVTDATGVQGLKHGKPKPTNPKPFRLRTDERGILKEATLEKKIHASPLKEIMSVTRFPGGSLQKKQRALLRNDKSLERPSSTTNETLPITLPGQLGVIKEESPEILLRPKEVAKPSKSSAYPETKASAVPRQSLQGRRRSTTIPKEPNFHTIHTPKSCTRRVA
nr:uncharacterized protein LOC118048631 [Populus alba]